MGSLLLLLMIGVTCTQAVEMCNTEEQRGAAVQEALDAIQCDNYTCGMHEPLCTIYNIMGSVVGLMHAN